MATSILQAFNEFKTRLELSVSLQALVSVHHGAVRDWIESYAPSVETLLIGSLQRKTRIQPRANKDNFDIDILIILGDFATWVSEGGISPADALDKVEVIVSEHETYDRMGPETDSPTIIIEYADDTKLELVPAYLDNIGHAPDGTPTLPKGRGYWIPRNNRWVIADYRYDADCISLRNKESDGWLIPTIKMLKAIKRNLFPHVKSFHLEILATNYIPFLINTYKEQGSRPSYPALISGLFYYAKNAILRPCVLSGSKSPDASSYLSSSQKSTLATLFTGIEQVCNSLLPLDGRDAVEGWKKLFGEPFPSYG